MSKCPRPSAHFEDNIKPKYKTKIQNQTMTHLISLSFLFIIIVIRIMLDIQLLFDFVVVWVPVEQFVNIGYDVLNNGGLKSAFNSLS